MFLAEDAVFVLPYALSGETEPAAATRFEGRAAITEGFLADVFAQFERIRFVEQVITVGADGRTVFVEAHGDFLTADGRPSQNRYVVKFTVDGETITRIDEYHNPVTIGVVLDRPLGPSANPADPAATPPAAG